MLAAKATGIIVRLRARIGKKFRWPAGKQDADNDVADAAMLSFAAFARSPRLTGPGCAGIFTGLRLNVSEICRTA